MAQNTLTDLGLRLKAELLADKKKSTLMAALLVVALGLGLKMVVGGEGPRKAAAAPVATAAEDAAASASLDRSGGGEALDAYLETIDPTVGRDLFATQLEAFRVVKTAAPAESLGKSAVKPADRAGVPARLRQEAEIRRLADALHLQSTMTGGCPTAIINGHIVACGHKIGGFVVEKIDSGSCVVTRGAVKITLEMAQ